MRGKQQVAFAWCEATGQKRDQAPKRSAQLSVRHVDSERYANGLSRRDGRQELMATVAEMVQRRSRRFTGTT